MNRALSLLAMGFLFGCDPTPVLRDCRSDSDCISGRCVDSRCVATEADAAADVSVDAGRAEDAGADVVLDVPVDVEVPLSEWVLSVTNEEANTVHALLRVSVAEADYGSVTAVCEDIILPPTVPAENIISSLTFNRNVLYASGKGVEHGDTLFIIDPCSCTATEVGRYGYTFVAGITSHEETEMYGLSGRESVLLDVDPATGAAAIVRELGVDWTTVGLTAGTPGEDTLWAISGATDELVQFALDGTVLLSRPLLYDFDSVGIEYHPGVDTIFACSASGELLVVDPESGEVSVGPQFSGKCSNLAAPFGSVACII